jgi:signal transduction histidine kinase
VGERLLAVKGLLDRIEEQLRRLSQVPAHDSDDLGLVARLSFWAWACGAAHRVQAWGRSEERLPGPIETVLYRIVQEALNNVAKHARAATVTIAVSLDARHVSCSVRDDGVGFDPQATRAGDHGIGLIGIRERLTPLGGVFSIASAHGSGTELRVTIPLGH